MRGFALFEVTLALVLAAVVLLAAHAFAAAVIDVSTALLARYQGEGRETQGRALLAERVAGLVVGDSAEFRGTRISVAFTAWQRTPLGGWTLSGQQVSVHSDTLWLTGLPLLAGVRELGLDYLLAAGAGSVWVREWHSRVAAPLAVRLRLSRSGRTDTLLLRVGERG